VWVEAGRDGQVFTYANTTLQAIGAGDLVRVRLRGRPHVGLVMEGLAQLPPELEGRPLEPVLAVLQAAAVDSQWQALIQAVATFTHTSPFRTLRTALPPGWLGQRPSHRGLGRRQWQLELEPAATDPTSETLQTLTQRQRELITYLQERQGQALLQQISRSGFSSPVVQALESRGLVRRQAVLVTPQAPGTAQAAKAGPPPAAPEAP